LRQISHQTSHWITAPGTSDPEERRIVTEADRRLRALPGVQATGTHIGQAFLGEEIAGVNFAEEWVTIAPDVDYDRTISAIRGIVNSYPGMYHNIVTYLNERIEEVLTGTQEPVVVRIYGPDLTVLRAKGQEIQHRLAAVSGIVDDHMDLQVDEPQVQVEVDLAKAARYGLKPGDIRRAASTLVAGEEVGDIFRAGKAYDVMVWSTPQTRSNVPDIANLPIDTPAGPRTFAVVGVYEDPSAVLRYRNALTRLNNGADSPEDSLARIRRRLKELS